MQLGDSVIKSMVSQSAAQTTCCDCGASNPSFTSLNNGIFLCLTCANTHKTFGEQYSYIQSIANDKWNDTSLLYVRFGSNDNFKNFIKNYKLLEKSAEYRYKTLAAEYYRMRVFFMQI